MTVCDCDDDSVGMMMMSLVTRSGDSVGSAATFFMPQQRRLPCVRCSAFGHAMYGCGNKDLQFVRMLSPQKAVCVGADQSFTAFIMI